MLLWKDQTEGRYFQGSLGVFVFPGPRPWPWTPAPIYIWQPLLQICFSQPRTSICIYRPRPSTCVPLFFALRLKFVIVTVSTYINSAAAPVQYIQGSQYGAVNGSRSLDDSKYKPVDDNSLPVKLRENKNSINKENHGVRKSTSKKEIIIVGDSMIKHVSGREASQDNSVKIRCHLDTSTDGIIDYVSDYSQEIWYDHHSYQY